MAAYMPVPEPVGVSATVVDNAYQSSSNQMRQAFPVISTVPTKHDLANKSLGGSQLISLPQGSLLGATLLTLKIKAGAIPIGYALDSGWGYNAIDYIEVSVGDSTQLMIRGNMLLKNVVDCEDLQKRDSLVTLGGEVHNGDVANTKDLYAYVCLYAPWSNMAAARCIPFDSSIVSRPCQINIVFKPSSQVFKKLDPSVTAAPPSAFAEAYVTQKTMNFVHQSDSIRDLVGPAGSSEYTFGYIFPQAWRAGEPKSLSPIGSTPNLVRCDSFMNGSILSMDLYLTLTRAKYTVGDWATAAEMGVNPSLYFPMYNITAEYAGQDIYKADDGTAQLLDLTEFPAANYFATTTTGGVLTSGAFAPSEIGAKSHFYRIPLAQFNERFHSNYVQYAPSIVNQTLAVGFNTINATDLAALLPTALSSPARSGVITDAEFVLNVSVQYAAGIRVAKGSASMIFTQPTPLLERSLIGASAFAGQ